MLLIYHSGVSASEAQHIVEDLVTRKAPAVQDFDGFLKVLNPKLSASDFCLVLLYQRGIQGAKYEDLEKWVRPSMRTNLRRTLATLVNSKAFLHFENRTYKITGTGQQYVEKQRLLATL
jgi:hypothetical protein